MRIRQATEGDRSAIWAILQPIIRAGEHYALPSDWSEQQALDYWFSATNTVFVAVVDDAICGTYYLRPNNLGGGDHIANCGFMVAADSAGQGVATNMCTHALKAAKEAGFTAMQFNLVLVSNVRAIGLWTKMGFETIGHLPKVFDHPKLGMIDALVMFKELE